MNLSYAQYGSDCIMVLDDDSMYDSILCYANKKDRDLIHELFGGEQFYSSRSGICGMGYITNTNKANKVIKMGYYRVENREMKKQIIAYVDNDDYAPIFGYVPLIKVRNAEENFIIEHDMPIVLSDGDKVVYTYEKGITEVVVNWKKLPCKVCNIKYHYHTGGLADNFSFKLCNELKFRNLNAIRFLNIDEIKFNSHESLIEDDSFLYRKLHLKKNKYGTFHLTREGFIDKFWEKNEVINNIEGDIVEGWQGTGKNLFYRRVGVKMQVFYEYETRASEFGLNLFEDKPIHCFDEVSVIEWYSKKVEDFIDLLKNKCFEEGKTSLKNECYFNINLIDLKQLLMEYSEKTLNFNGMDEYDTPQDIVNHITLFEKYDLEKDSNNRIPVKDILDSIYLDNILKSITFQNVIINSLVFDGRKVPLLSKD